MTDIKYSIDKTMSEIYDNKLQLNGNTTLIRVCCNLYNTKKLKDYTIEDIRTMVGQDIGVELLMPLAIEELELNIFAEGDMYPGDLIRSISNIDSNYWKENREQKYKVLSLIKESIEQLDRYYNNLLNR